MYTPVSSAALPDDKFSPAVKKYSVATFIQKLYAQAISVDILENFKVPIQN